MNTELYRHIVGFADVGLPQHAVHQPATPGFADCAGKRVKLQNLQSKERARAWTCGFPSGKHTKKNKKKKRWKKSPFAILVGGLVAMNFIFPFSWECHHPN